MRVLSATAATGRGILTPAGGPATFSGAEGVELATYLCGACGKPTVSAPYNITLANAAVRCPACGAINDLARASSH
jgi:DNA-directed RNA polymerase subunit RPC12/RpoP